ncbi:MAG: hypothetical protein EAZ97_03585 [Bacteroidetes bacterium]|nr:MAG: hypothetical protein EAZ97_03585 [Bacteroidota bacterium]
MTNLSKKEYLALLQTPNLVGETEIDGLQILTQKYPFFQSAYVLKAKAENSASSIQKAAIYTLDRSLLQKIIHQNYNPHLPPPPVVRIAKVQKTEIIEEKIAETPQIQPIEVENKVFVEEKIIQEIKVSSIDLSKKAIEEEQIASVEIFSKAENEISFFDEHFQEFTKTTEQKTSEKSEIITESPQNEELLLENKTETQIILPEVTEQKTQIENENVSFFEEIQSEKTIEIVEEKLEVQNENVSFFEEVQSEKAPEIVEEKLEVHNENVSFFEEIQSEKTTEIVEEKPEVQNENVSFFEEIQSEKTTEIVEEKLKVQNENVSFFEEIQSEKATEIVEEKLEVQNENLGVFEESLQSNISQKPIDKENTSFFDEISALQTESSLADDAEKINVPPFENSLYVEKENANELISFETNEFEEKDFFADEKEKIASEIEDDVKSFFDEESEKGTKSSEKTEENQVLEKITEVSALLKDSEKNFFEESLQSQTETTEKPIAEHSEPLQVLENTEVSAIKGSEKSFFEESLEENQTNNLMDLQNTEVVAEEEIDENLETNTESEHPTDDPDLAELLGKIDIPSVFEQHSIIDADFIDMISPEIILFAKTESQKNTLQSLPVDIENTVFATKNENQKTSNIQIWSSNEFVQTENKVQQITSFSEVTNVLSTDKPVSQSLVFEQDNDLQSPFSAAERMAKMYVQQNNTAKALTIYERLLLQYPEKTSYFSEQIEKLKH